jgi:hypothetical protein
MQLMGGPDILKVLGDPLHAKCLSVATFFVDKQVVSAARRACQIPSLSKV